MSIQRGSTQDCLTYIKHRIQSISSDSKIQDLTNDLRGTITSCQRDNRKTNSDLVNFLACEFASHDRITVDVLRKENMNTKSLLQLTLDLKDDAVYQQLVSLGFLKYTTNGDIGNLRALLEEVNNIKKPIILELDGLYVALKMYHITKKEEFQEIANFFFGVIERHRNDDVCKLDVNRQITDGGSQNAPLYFALKYGNEEQVFRLLTWGARLDKANNYGLRPVDFMREETLRKYLDQLLEFHESDRVIINYEPVRTDRYNCNIIRTIIENKELHNLINHPVIATALSARWYQFRYTIMLDIILKLIRIFLVLLVTLLPSVNGFRKFSMVIVMISTTVSLWWSYKCVFNMSLWPYTEFTVFVLTILSFMDDVTNYAEIATSLTLIFTGFYALSLFFYLSKFAVYVEMLKLVAQHCLWFLLFCAVPILFLSGAAHKHSKSGSFADTLYRTLRLLFMKNASESLDQNHFVMILILIVIGGIATNSMVGIIVNDISTIHKDAEAFVCVDRARFILAIERTEFKMELFRKLFRPDCPKKLTAMLIENRTIEVDSEKYFSKLRWNFRKMLADFRRPADLNAGSLSIINDIFQKKHGQMYNFKNFMLLFKVQGN